MAVKGGEEVSELALHVRELTVCTVHGLCARTECVHYGTCRTYLGCARPAHPHPTHVRLLGGGGRHPRWGTFNTVEGRL